MIRTVIILFLIVFSMLRLEAQKVIFVKDSVQHKSYFNRDDGSLLAIKFDKEGKPTYVSKSSSPKDQGAPSHEPPKRLNKSGTSIINKLVTSEMQKNRFPSAPKAATLNYKVFSASRKQIDSVAYCITIIDTTLKPNHGRLRNEKFVAFQSEDDKSKVSEAIKNAFKKSLGYKTEVQNETFGKVQLFFDKHDLDKFLKSKADTITKISLAKFGLTEFPEELKRFKNLKEIDLRENFIEHIKIDKRDFPELETLTLHNNLLTGKRVRFSGGIKLKTLNLSNNFYTEIPKKTAQTKTLLLANSELKALRPKDIKKLKKVETLNLYSNQISLISPKIKRLKHLKELDLYRNELNVLPKNLTKIKNLETLALSYNNLIELPAYLANFKKLRVLYAHHNKINRLPELPLTLENLDVGYNKLEEIENQLIPLTSLKTLDYSNNFVKGDLNFLLNLPHIKEIYLFENKYASTEEEGKHFSDVFYKLLNKGVTVK